MQANQSDTTIYKDIVLIGGGHAHAIVIKMWGMHPLAGVRLTLISSTVDTPYSGMLPGLVSGHYSFEQTHIDLFTLCSWAGVRFICAEVTNLNAEKKSIELKERPSIEYDLVSINTGSTPNINKTVGAAQFATAVKPISLFYQKWQSLKDTLANTQKPLNIALVGAGAGGFELLLAMHHHAKKINKNHPHKFHWIVSGDTVLIGHNSKVQQHALAICKSRDIEVHFNFKVAQVTEHSLISNRSQPLSLSIDEVIWCTAASPAIWPEKAGLAITDQGFIAIDDHLRSTSHNEIFAVGDVATQVANPRPKAGVFAVRQGPILFKNLRRAILQKTLLKHKPQKHFLSLLATGDKHAIASRGAFFLQGALMWRYKNHIDVQFMDSLQKLAPKKEMLPQKCDPILFDQAKQHSLVANPTQMRCGGCGAKVSSDILSATLKKITNQITTSANSSVIIGLDSPDDAAVIDPQQQLLVQSIDQFRAIVDDPYLFAKITVNHALSDLYAMNCQAHSALAVVSMPFASKAVQQRELYQLMYGVIEQLNSANCTLIGGHTSESSELSLGLSANAFTSKAQLATKTGVTENQVLILTKPLGTGVVMAAHMQHIAKGTAVQKCINTMLQENFEAANILASFNCSAMTDVTGFGLIGHLLEMLRDSKTQCQITLSSLPLIEDALRLSQLGVQSSLYPQNLEQAVNVSYCASHSSHEKFPLLFDPQTSGGLLAFVDTANAQQCITLLHQAGFQDACVIASTVKIDDTNQQPISLTP